MWCRPLPGAQINPLADNAVIKQIPLKEAPEDLFSLGRTIMLLRGLCFALGLNIQVKPLVNVIHWTCYCLLFLASKSSRCQPPFDHCPRGPACNLLDSQSRLDWCTICRTALGSRLLPNPSFIVCLGAESWCQIRSLKESGQQRCASHTQWPSCHVSRNARQPLYRLREEHTQQALFASLLNHAYTRLRAVCCRQQKSGGPMLRLL